MASLGQLTLSLVARTGGFTGPIERARNQSNRQFKRMERDAKSAAASLAKISAAAAGAAAGLVVFGKTGMDNIDAQAKLSRQLDTTIGGLRGITLAASDAGVEQGKLESALLSLNKRLGDAARGTGEAQKAYKELGLDAAELADMPLPERLAAIAERINQLDNAAQRQSIADSLMSGGRNVVKLFESGGDAIHAAIEEVEGFGLAVDEVDAAAIEAANDSIARLGIVSESAQNAVAVRLAPALGDMADELMRVTKAFHDGEYDEQIGLIQRVATVAGGAAGAYAAYRTAIGAATIAQWAFNAAARANPLAALATVAGTAAGALYTFREELGLVSPEAETAVERVDTLTSALNSNSRAALENARSMLEAEQQLARFNAATLALQRNEQQQVVFAEYEKWESVGGQQAFGMGQSSEAQEELDKIESQLLDARRAGELAADGINEVDKRLEGLGNNSGADVVERVYSSATDGARALREQTDAIDEQSSALQSLIDRLYPTAAAQRQFREDMQLLAEADAAGAIDDLADAQQRLREANAERMAGGLTDAPEFGGLAGSVGGSLGEMGKIAEAQEALQEWYGTQLEMLAEFREQRAELSQQWDEREREIHEQHQARVLELERARGVAQLQAAQSIFGDLTDVTRTFAGEQSDIYKTMFAIQKAAAIAQSIIAIQQGIAMAAANPWPLNLAAMASVAAATAGLVSNIASVAAPQGMAHDGIDSVPSEGTWLLDKGERVISSPQADKLDQFLAQQGGRGGGDITVNLIEDKRRAGSSQERQGADGQREIDVFVADIMGDGPRSNAIRNKFGLTPQGR